MVVVKNAVLEWLFDRVASAEYLIVYALPRGAEVMFK